MDERICWEVSLHTQSANWTGDILAVQLTSAYSATAGSVRNLEWLYAALEDAQAGERKQKLVGQGKVSSRARHGLYVEQ